MIIGQLGWKKIDLTGSHTFGGYATISWCVIKLPSIKINTDNYH